MLIIRSIHMDDGKGAQLGTFTDIRSVRLTTKVRYLNDVHFLIHIFRSKATEQKHHYFLNFIFTFYGYIFLTRFFIFNLGFSPASGGTFFIVVNRI